MVVAARHGVDVRRVGKIMNDADLLEGITIPDSPSALADFYTSAEGAKLGRFGAATVAKFHQAYAEKWAKSPEGQKMLTEVDAQAIKGLANATSPEELDASAHRVAMKVIENLLKGDDQNRTALNRLNIDPRNPGNRGDGWRTRPSMTPGKPRFWNKHAPGAAIDGQFDFGDFMVAAGGKDMASIPKEFRAVRTKLEEIQDSYSGTVPGDGGFLVPEEFRATLLELAMETSIVQPRATVIPMTALKLRIPMIDSNTNVGQVMGGMVAYWTEEQAELVESQAKFGSVLLEAQKLTGLSGVPNELMMDAPGMAAFVERSWPKALAFFADIAYIRGDGVGQPLGFLGAANTAAVQVTVAGGQGANTITSTNIFDMASRMLPSSFGNSVWLVAHDAMGQIFKLAAADSSPVFITNIAGSAPVTILGRPVIFTEKTQKLGSRGDIALVDLSYYLIGDRMTMQMARSEHAQFTKDKTMFRIVQRTDGRPWLNTPITPANGSTATLTPFVELEADRA